MATLTTRQRNALSKSMFALPDKRAFPIMDPSHARNAIARATQQVNAGNLSPDTADKIKAKAKAVLSKKGK